ncbi:outer membrane efflux protein [Magnetococcus marinus MC-1]|uniref:Outer membrane efflux protein n=1 Tax=Magnetococcus marinus (strain ATCC BAA-1437 / JCM 17883 / MC-1) TaxID=156889 RepID=A0L4Q3_MAGMM|nr:TolC family protein [Magnetococcus marinus]ABK42946.1 outer membrane efflux protein [Magnetococcus marinus MC-1]
MTTITNRRSTRLLAALSALALLSACSVKPTPFTQAEFAAQAKADRTAMFQGQQAVTTPLTLNEAVARVLKYNLDKRSKMMDEALALGQTYLDRYDLLPKLEINAGHTERSEINATRSRDLVTQTTTANPTYSEDRSSTTADLGLTWNILDFGVSYFTAHQNADRALIAQEKRRKTINNLVQEVRFTFWRAAAAQNLKTRVSQVIATAESALQDSERVEGERLRNPIESLRVQKTMLESIRQLEAIDQELNAAKAELAALINLPPGSDFQLDVPSNDGMAIPEWPLSVEEMEEAAMVNNPDLREQGYQSRIALDDTRKEILKLLPGITLSFSRQYDSNSFMVDNRWNDAGAKVTWNLLNLLSGPDRIAHSESVEKLAEVKRLALRMAVLAQVHVVSHQFASASKQFERAHKLWTIERRLAEAAGNQSRGGTVNEIERISTETSAIAAELRRYQTYAQVQLSYGKLQATIGADPVPERLASHALDGIAGAIVLDPVGGTQHVLAEDDLFRQQDPTHTVRDENAEPLADADAHTGAALSWLEDSTSKAIKTEGHE